MYKISFISPTGSKIELEVSAEVYALFEVERKYQQRIAKEYDRHLDYRHLDDVHHKSAGVSWSVYAQRIEDEETLDKLIKILEEYCTAKQTKRFLLYYEGYTLEQIAEIDGCSKAAISVSIKAVREKIKKFYEFLKTI